MWAFVKTTLKQGALKPYLGTAKIDSFETNEGNDMIHSTSSLAVVPSEPFK